MPQLSVPDNTKTGVTKACRYDPDLNPTYQEFAMHYGMGVLPTRPYKQRSAVSQTRWIAGKRIPGNNRPALRPLPAERFDMSQWSHARVNIDYHVAWHEQIGDATVADGILDRLVHNAHRIEMRGDSMRKNRGNANA